MIEMINWSLLLKFLKEHKLLERLLSLFERRHTILVVGCSGVGKTQFIASLKAIMAEIIRREARTRSVVEENLKIEGLALQIKDTPGQDAYEPLRRAAYDRSKGNIDLIIDVTCFGYHEFPGGERYAVDQSGNAKEAFLQSSRERELEQVGEVKEVLQGDSPPRLITLISKADLWWDRQEAVLEHYQSGPYREALGDDLTSTPIFLPYSARIAKFYGTSPHSGYFDDTDRLAVREELLRVFVETLTGKRS